MPEFSPADPLTAVAEVKYIPAGEAFRIHEVKSKRNEPWYRVSAIDGSAKQIGAGWINSTALLGQNLKAYK